MLVIERILKGRVRAVDVHKRGQMESFANINLWLM